MAKTPEYTRNAVNRYREKFDFIQIKLPKGTKEEIEKLTCKKATAYISEMVLNKLKNMEENGKTEKAENTDTVKKPIDVLELQKLLDERKIADQKKNMED